MRPCTEEAVSNRLPWGEVKVSKEFNIKRVITKFIIRNLLNGVLKYITSLPSGFLFPNIFLVFFLFLIGGWILCNVVLVSPIQQHKSAINIYMFPLSWTSLTPSHPTGHHRAPCWAPCFRQQLPTSNLFYTVVYTSILLYQFVSPSPSHPMSIFYICILFLSCKQAHLYHLSINRFHRDALIYDICFSLSDLVLPMTDSRSIHITTNDSVVDLSSSTRDWICAPFSGSSAL